MLAEPLVARVPSRVADAFMAVEEDDAVAAMKCLAQPADRDPAIVSGESGCNGLAGLIRSAVRAGLERRRCVRPSSRILLVNTEGATDPGLYERLVGARPRLCRNKEVMPV